MATILDTQLTGLVLSMNIPNLTYSTTQDKVTFSICNTGTDTAIFSSTLYAYDGKVTAYDVRGIMEKYMRENDIPFYCFRIRAEDATSDVNVLFCSLNPNDSA